MIVVVTQNGAQSHALPTAASQYTQYGVNGAVTHTPALNGADISDLRYMQSLQASLGTKPKLFDKPQNPVQATPTYNQQRQPYLFGRAQPAQWAESNYHRHNSQHLYSAPASVSPSNQMFASAGLQPHSQQPLLYNTVQQPQQQEQQNMQQMHQAQQAQRLAQQVKSQTPQLSRQHASLQFQPQQSQNQLQVQHEQLQQLQKNQPQQLATDQHSQLQQQGQATPHTQNQSPQKVNGAAEIALENNGQSLPGNKLQKSVNKEQQSAEVNGNSATKVNDHVTARHTVDDLDDFVVDDAMFATTVRTFVLIVVYLDALISFV